MIVVIIQISNSLNEKKNKKGNKNHIRSREKKVVNLLEDLIKVRLMIFLFICKLEVSV